MDNAWLAAFIVSILVSVTLLVLLWRERKQRSFFHHESVLLQARLHEERERSRKIQTSRPQNETRLYDDVLSHLPEPFSIFDHYKRYVFNNAAAATAIGRPLSFLQGKTVAELGLAANFVQSLEKRLDDIIRDPQITCAEFAFPGPLGMPAAYELVMYPILDENGKVEQVACIAHNVSRRRQAEEERDRLFNLSPDMLCIAGVDGFFKRLSPAFERVLGYTQNELLSRPAIDFVLPKDRAATLREIEKLAQGRPSVNFENRFQRKDGSTIWLSWNSQPAGDYYYGIARDISELKQKQQALISSKEEAERATRVKSDFLAAISHDIRTPLGAIIGFAELLREHHISVPDRTAFTDTIIRNGRQLSHLIDDLLDLSKVEAGKLAVSIERVRIDEILASVESLFTPPAKSKGLELHIIRDTNALDTIETDPTRLQQILFNLVSNAVKFTERGHVTITCSIKKVDHRPRLAFLVQDTGPGLSEEEKQYLFQAYTQIGEGVKKGGTGLGLILSRNLARALGGDVEIGSCAPGAGCTFIATIDPGNVGRLPPQPVSKAPQFHHHLDGLRTLIVDDSEDNRTLVHRILTRQGAVVDGAIDGEDGVQKALSTPYDIILMDLQMPKKDGYAAVTELRQRGYDKPIVALTAHAMTEEIERTRKCGFNGHIRKPMTADELIKTILNLTSSNFAL